jgi:recombination protein RecA
LMHDDARRRRQAIDEVMGNLERQFGRGCVHRLSSSNFEPLTTIPTGAISLDAAIGAGGFPRGRIVEIFGPESSGKTTLALHAVAECQAKGGTAAYIDAEHALDPNYAADIGVKLDQLVLAQPHTGEQALEICGSLAASGVLDLIVVDSVAALVPRVELEGDMGVSYMGSQARLMSQGLRKITGVVSRSDTCLLFLNQMRERIGVMLGGPETTSGGRALKFYASLRLDVRRIGAIRDGETVVGNRTRAKLVKNKVAAPFREAEFDILYGQGISKSGDLLDTGLALGLVQKSGNWYSYNGQRIGQGRESARQYLVEHETMLRRLDLELRAKLGFAGAEANTAKALAKGAG